MRPSDDNYPKEFMHFSMLLPDYFGMEEFKTDLTMTLGFKGFDVRDVQERGDYLYLLLAHVSADQIRALERVIRSYSPRPLRLV